MKRKIIIILSVVVAISATLYFFMWSNKNVPEARFIDRLPQADLVGTAYLPELSESLNNLSIQEQLPFSQFLSHEFVLNQIESSGIEINKQAYYFANWDSLKLKDAGMILHVSDTSLLERGLDKMAAFLSVNDTIILEQKVRVTEDKQMYFTYGKDWFLAYQGKDFQKVFHKVVMAKYGSINTKWENVLDRDNSKTNILNAQVDSELLNKVGVKELLLSLKRDSSKLIMNTTIEQFDDLSFDLKEEGFGYDREDDTKTLINLNFDISRLKKNPQDPIVELLTQMTKKVNFPVREFLNAWEGDLAYRQGGMRTIKEKYIVSEFDENFNAIEVIKYKTREVPEYSFFLSMNSNSTDFISTLKSKGILRADKKKFRLLYFPPFEMESKDGSVEFYTGNQADNISKREKRDITFLWNQTPVSVYIDSTSSNSVFGRVEFSTPNLVDEMLIP